jgi:hypothetical protein
VDDLVVDDLVVDDLVVVGVVAVVPVGDSVAVVPAVDARVQERTC